MFKRELARCAIVAVCALALTAIWPGHTQATAPAAPVPRLADQPGPAPVAPALAPAAQPSSSPCRAMAMTDEWLITIDATFSATGAEPGVSAAHQQSANMQFVVKGAQMEDSMNVSHWSTPSEQSAVTGSGSLNARLVQDLGGCNGINCSIPAASVGGASAGAEPAPGAPGGLDVTQTEYVEQGNGPPIAGSTAALLLNRDTCTYSLDVEGLITSTVTNSQLPAPTQNQAKVLDLHVTNRFYAVDGARDGYPELSFGGFLTVPINSFGAQDFFDAAESAGMGAIKRIFANQGQTTIGQAQVSWKLTPKPVTYSLENIVFKELNVRSWPNPDFITVRDDLGTYDGNYIQLQFAIWHSAASIVGQPVRVLDDETGKVLPDGEWIATFGPQQEDLSLSIDTDGWAWKEGTPPTSHNWHTLRIEIGPKEKPFLSKTKTLIVRPRPVILVHGLNSNAGGWAAYPAFLQNARILANHIQNVRQMRNAWHVDIVAHSMGGLISRQYVHSMMPTAERLDGKPAFRQFRAAPPGPQAAGGLPGLRAGGPA